MRSQFDLALEARLIRYAAIDSQSDAASSSSPSTAIQLDILTGLKAELEEIGASDVRLTDYGVVLATIPASPGVTAPVMGLLAHVDTAPAFAAAGVKPVVHRGWNGGDISFADAPDLVLSPDASEYLATKQGHDIITASGTTLLGADDKAGVAIIMTAAEHLLANPDVAHGPIRIAFTPDEEIGRGVDARLPADLGADFAYTFDGAKLGDLNFESFSADGAEVRVTGVSIHPGDAKDTLVNALHIAATLIDALAHAAATPDLTKAREGFIFASEMAGNAAEARLSFILRDFELDGLAAKGALMQQVCATVAARNPRAQVICEIRPQYRNMRYWLEQDMGPVDLARSAMQAEGITPVSNPIRGGTDGSRLTEMGVPTPNIFTGMQDIHGPLEWISVQDMAMATKVCLRLAELASRAAP
jgi:tripeptide aminopeptidase